MKNNSFLKSLFATMMLLSAFCTRGQNEIGITLNINPPYSTRITEYVESPGKMLLIIRNNTNQVKNIYLRGSITGDNGISMSNDPNVKPSTPVVLQPFQVYNANNSYLQELFSVERYKMTGITLTQIAQKNGLPEGNYNICVRAYDYTTNAPLSGDAPQGCKMLMMANLEPPIPIKPLAEEEVKAIEPQIIVFSWTLPAGAQPGTQYKLRMVEMMDAKKNINDAYNSATTPTFFETTVPANVFVYGAAQPKLVPGRKYAWAVTAIAGTSKTAYKNNGTSEIRAFTYGSAEPPKPVITLLYPNDKASFGPMGGGMNQAFSFKWDYTVPGKQFYNEDVFVYEIKAGQTAEQAVKSNQRVNSTKEPSKSAMFSCSGSPDGKSYAWVVKLFGDGKSYSSEVRSFTVGDNNITEQTFTNFDFCGYPVKVNSLKDKGGFMYSGVGVTRLYNGGPDVTLYFDNISIKPFGSKPIPGKDNSHTQSTDWRAVSGSVKSGKLYNTKIFYKLPADIDGELRFKADQLELTAAIKAEFDKTKDAFVVKETYGGHGAKLSGTFTWETDYLYAAENGEEKTAVYTDNVEAKFDYENTFSEDEPFYLQLKTPDGYNTMKLTAPKNTTLNLVPVLYIAHKGTSPKFKFSGYFEIPKLKNGKPGLTVNFTNKGSMSFSQNVSYSVPVTNDNSVVASFDNVNISIAFTPYIKIPQLNMKFAQGSKSYTFNFTKAFFTATDGLYCKENKLTNGAINIAGFDVGLKNSKISLVQSKLFELNIEGDFEIPFIKQKADVIFYASEEGIQKAGVSFDLGKKTILYQNMAGDKCLLEPNSGIFQSDRLVMSGLLSFSNLNGSEQNFNIVNQQTPDFYIKANGDVGIENGSLSGGTVPYQVAGKYNGFKFSASEMNIKKTTGSKYRISMNGMLVLADNLSSDTKLPNFNASVDFDASKIKGGGPQPDQEVSFSSSDVSGGRHDAAVDFGVKFKYFNNDPVYGKGFLSDDYFGIQQPELMQVHAKMIVARAPEGFNYWFFEAGQENVVQIPTGVLDLGIYGFTGRVYYKMNHAGNNISKDDYVPDKNKFIGIYGLTKLKTLTDNGIKFWGDVSFELLTNKSGLESIKYRGGGQFISTGVGSNGMVGAKDCELDFYWAPVKELYGEFNVSGNFVGALSVDVDAGFDVTSDVFHLWAGGEAYLFSSKLFKCGDFGMDLTQDNINIWGNYYLVNIDKSWDFGICEPSVTLKSGVYMDAYINYSPFLFKGSGSLYGTLKVAGCKLHKTFHVNLGAQVMFPSPTCVSAGIDISTPLKDFTLGAGIRNGSIFWGSCF